MLIPAQTLPNIAANMEGRRYSLAVLAISTNLPAKIPVDLLALGVTVPAYP